MQEQGPQLGGHLIQLVDQQGAPTQQLQQRSLPLTGTAIAAGSRTEQVGAIRPEQGPIEPQHQLVTGHRTEMNQGGEVVLFQARLTADQNRSGLGIGGSLASRLPQAAGIAAAADHATAGAAHQKRGQPQQLRGSGRRSGAHPAIVIGPDRFGAGGSG